MIGVVVLAMAFAEGSANDWLPLLMVDGHGFSPTSGSLIYAGFTLGMTVGRFTGGWFIDRYSRVAVVRASANGSARYWSDYLRRQRLGRGRFRYSLGAWGVAWLPANDFSGQRYRPGRANPRQRGGDNRLSGLLVGPPLLGYLGEHYGLRSAMLVVLALVILAALVAKAVAKPTSNTQSVMENS